MILSRANTSILAVQKRIFWAFIVCLVALFALYGYFVCRSIVGVLSREQIEQQITAVDSELSTLATTYLKQEDAIDLAFAYEHGFHDVTNRTFVTEKPYLGTKLTTNTDL